MKLKPIKSNMTELEIGDKTILFSYKTPVAVIFENSNEVWKTEQHYSATTSRHVNQWLKANGKETLATEVAQRYIDEIVK